MGNFNKRGDRDGGDRGGFHGGGRDFGGRPNFDKKMFRATCAECGKSCEVPFAPTGEKPVYCRECFANKGGRSAERPQRNDFRPRSFSPNGVPGDNSGSDVRRQVEVINSKLDRLIEKVDALTRIKLAQEKDTTAPEPKKDNKKEIEKNKVDLKELVTEAVKPEKKKAAPKTAKKAKK
jgi:CxxC-x17-CxxC domain-containing protein